MRGGAPLTAPSGGAGATAAALPPSAPSPQHPGTPAAAVPLDREAFTYTACYCEENALLLSRRLVSAGLVPSAEALFVVFVTNARRQVPLWRQRAGRGDDGLVVWDYHVFVVEAAHGALAEPRIWDLDTTLPFPCSLSLYAAAALPPVRHRFARRFRVVPAPHLRRHFASDRSHMLRPDGSWSAPPPAYPPFVAESDGCTNRLWDYLEVGAPSNHGSGSDEDESRGGDGSSSSRGGSGVGALAKRPVVGGGGSGPGPPEGEMGVVLGEGAFLLLFLRPPGGQQLPPDLQSMLHTS